MISCHWYATVLLTFLTIFFTGCNREQPVPVIGILQWTERIQPFLQTSSGILDTLRNHGYHDDPDTLRIVYRNVEQDKGVALEAAREMVRRKVDLIIALGTGSSLAALEATRDTDIPIIYSIVGAPVATGIIPDNDTPGGNISGISMRIPAAEQLAVLAKIMPTLDRLGIIYCTEMVQAVATAKETAQAARELGWTPVSVAVLPEQLPTLREKVQQLARGVDTVVVPTDPILTAPDRLAIILKECDAAGVPVIGVSDKFVEKGMLMAVHCDFYEIGKQAGSAVVQLLNGTRIKDIPPQQPLIKHFSLNLKKAEALNIKLPRNIILQADNLYD